MSTGGCIPDAAMIHAARKCRQKARELGTEYIPIEEQRYYFFNKIITVLRFGALINFINVFFFFF